LQGSESKSRQVRLFVEDGLCAGGRVEFQADAANYLRSVMRLENGCEILLFNGRDGEWSARIDELGKRRACATCLYRNRPQSFPPDLWLAFAPIKKSRTDFVVEKAAELGVDRIHPVLCARSNTRRISRERLRQRAIEAAEQCGGLNVPSVGNLTALEDFLSCELGDRKLVFCDESMSCSGKKFPGEIEGDSFCILVGPEGGFSEQERDLLRDVPNSLAVSLGPRILRAETAAVAAIALWQQFNGDW